MNVRHLLSLRLIYCLVGLLLLGNAQAGVVVSEDATGTVYNDDVFFSPDEQYNGDWYIPNKPATGLVYLQHGFARNSGKYRDLGNALMAQGIMVLSINASMVGGAEPLANTVADSLQNNPPQPPLGAALPSAVVVSGHSAGALHASLIAKRMVQNGFAGLSGVVLADPVDAGGKFEQAVTELNAGNVAVKAITANPGPCNASNNTEDAIKALNEAYVGFKLTDRSTHIDVEGNNTDLLAKLVCGAPEEFNIVATRDFMVAWSNDMLTGQFSADFYPGGQHLSALLGSDQARLLKDTGGAWTTVLSELDGGSSFSSSFLTIVVPDVGVGEVIIETGGGSGRVDLYVKRDGDVSRRDYDCRSAGRGTDETCTLLGPGTYNILLLSGVFGHSGVKVTAGYWEY